jgi:hypothetical protein
VITDEQWKEVENKLAAPWGSAGLAVDGYDLRLEVRLIATRRYGIVPFVNGHHRGAWLLRNEVREWPEEARRFLPLRRRCLYTPAQLKRVRSKKVEKALRAQMFEYRSSYWTSFAALKRHLIANNKSIELVPDEVGS